MDDVRKAIGFLADAIRLLMETQGESIEAGDRFVISTLLRDAGELIANQSVGTDADSSEWEP